MSIDLETRISMPIVSVLALVVKEIKTQYGFDVPVADVKLQYDGSYETAEPTGVYVDLDFEAMKKLLGK